MDRIANDARQLELLKKAVGSLPRVRDRHDALQQRLGRVTGLLEAQKRHKELLEQQVAGLERRIVELEELAGRLETE